MGKKFNWLRGYFEVEVYERTAIIRLGWGYWHIWKNAILDGINDMNNQQFVTNSEVKELIYMQ